MSQIHKKLLYSLFAAIIFIIVSLQFSYNITNKLTGITSIHNSPSIAGHLIHTGVFFFLILLGMIGFNKYSTNQISSEQLIKYSFYSALLYYFISNSEVYILTSQVLGNTSNNNGPTDKGIIIHSIIYFVIILGMMTGHC